MNQKVIKTPLEPMKTAIHLVRDERDGRLIFDEIHVRR